MKYKKWEIKFFINWWFVKKWEIVWFTSYKKEIRNNHINKKEIKDVNLYFIQTWDFINYISNENIIFNIEEDKLYDTKVECFKLLDKTK